MLCLFMTYYGVGTRVCVYTCGVLMHVRVCVCAHLRVCVCVCLDLTCRCELSSFTCRRPYLVILFCLRLLLSNDYSIIRTAKSPPKFEKWT